MLGVLVGWLVEAAWLPQPTINKAAMAILKM